ncbi:hypothetical protein ASPTUDRAFT_803265 [Aspergillus tubingensis CBS 134.48]|uniref:Uncharacterized protein n=1 Tax=Aspergillus tubingensis (strain CBS 134.48) TaxID=767770 RepID=A0A1L9MVS3_ASPTC|nr:hypothetical protein ASPTUDRAFT_803265 [Aspergillus tubingensis CBS 134.48]
MSQEGHARKSADVGCSPPDSTSFGSLRFSFSFSPHNLGGSFRWLGRWDLTASGVLSTECNNTLTAFPSAPPHAAVAYHTFCSTNWDSLSTWNGDTVVSLIYPLGSRLLNPFQALPHWVDQEQSATLPSVYASNPAEVLRVVNFSLSLAMG